MSSTLCSRLGNSMERINLCWELCYVSMDLAILSIRGSVEWENAAKTLHCTTGIASFNPQVASSCHALRSECLPTCRLPRWRGRCQFLPTCSFIDICMQYLLDCKWPYSSCRPFNKYLHWYFQVSLYPHVCDNFSRLIWISAPELKLSY